MRLGYPLRNRRNLSLGAFVVVASIGTLGLVPVAHALDPFIVSTDALTNGTLSSGVAMGIADMNADGLDDLVRLNDANFLEIEYQQPDGTFTSMQAGNIEKIRVRARIEKAQTGLTAIDERIEDAWNAAEVELSEDNMKMLERLLPSYVRQHMQLAA